MPVIGGWKYSLDQFTHVGEWEIETYGPEQIALTTESTGQVQISVDGVIDWQGTVTGFGYSPHVDPGDTFTFTGQVGNYGPSGPAIVSRSTVQVNYEGNRPVQWAMEFAGNGDLTIASRTLEDTTPPEVIPASSAVVKINDAVPTDLASVILTLSNEVIGYSSTSTSGARKRIAGRFNAAARLTFYGEGNLPYSIGSLIALQIGDWKIFPLKIVNLASYGGGGEKADQPVTVNLLATFVGWDGNTKGYIITPNKTIWGTPPSG